MVASKSKNDHKSERVSEEYSYNMAEKIISKKDMWFEDTDKKSWLKTIIHVDCRGRFFFVKILFSSRCVSHFLRLFFSVTMRGKKPNILIRQLMYLFFRCQSEDKRNENSNQPQKKKMGKEEIGGEMERRRHNWRVIE